jgi:T-complex protein 1 subunit theta
MGDNTNLVITFAAELLNQAAELIKNGLHPSEILVGYEKAWKECSTMFDNAPQYKVSDLTKIDEAIKIIKPTIGSKLLQGHADILAPLIAEACISVAPSKSENFNVDSVRVGKILGGSLSDSQVIKGLVVARGCETATQKVENAKIVVYNCPLETQGAETKDTVLFKTADELLNYSRSEEDFMEKLIQGIKNTGVNVVVCGGSVSDIALHYFERYEMMVFRILSKFELRRVAKAVGAIPLVRLGAPNKEEIGFADRCYVDEISALKCIIIIRESEENKLATLVLRGSTMSLLDSFERTVEDGVNVYRNACKDPIFVPGAGAIEMFLSNGLKDFGKTITSLDQYAVKKFAESFEVVPRTLSENSGLNVNEVLANLNTKNSEDPHMGINIKNGEIENAFNLGVYDHLETKRWAIKFAVDSVLTILRVDQIILAKPAGGPKFDRSKNTNPENEEM